ncbi:MAG: M56 family metallopeptidase [Pirellulales bacterium]
MLSWLLLIAITTTILILGFLLAELCFYKRPGWQDLAWRGCLVALFIIPLGLSLRPRLGKVEVPIHSDLAGLNLQSNVLSQSLTSSTITDRWQTPIQVAPGEFIDRTANGSPKAIDNDNSKHALFSPKDMPLAVADQPPQSASTHSQPIESKTAKSEVTVTFVLSLAMFVLWLSVAIFKLLVLLRNWFRLRRISAAAKSAADNPWQVVANELSIQPAIHVAFSNQIQSPMVSPQLRQARVLIPASMSQETDGDLIRLVLSHELAHIRRRDYFFGMLVSIASSILWFHPLCIWMKRRILWLREILCDAQVAARFGSVPYAEALLKVATHHHNSLEMAMGAPASLVKSRVEFLFATSNINRLAVPRAISQFAWVALGLCVFAIAFLKPSGLESPSDAPSIFEPTAEFTKATLATEQQTSTAAKLTGTVFNPDGTAAKNGNVYLISRSEGSYTLPVEFKATKISADGSFQIADLKPGKYVVWAESESYSSLTGFLKGDRIEVAAVNQEQDKKLDLKLLPACSYKVLVKDKSTKQPIQNAEISFAWTDINRSYKTGADGVAHIRGLVANDWYFRVRADGRAATFLKTPSQSVGSVTELEFELDVGSTLSGKVVDQDGKPIAKCKIYPGLADRGMSPYFADKLETDAQGQFSLSSLPRDTRLSFSFDSEGYERYQRKEFTILKTQETYSLEIQLKKLAYGGDCKVLVVDQEGDPIAGAVVSNHGRSSDEVRTATTDENGLALVQNLFSSFDGMRGAVRAEGFVPKEFNLEKGTTEKPGMVTVKLDKGHTIRGRIVDAMGKPAAGLWVFYNSGENGATTGGRANSDNEGRFTITGLPLKSHFTIYTLAPHAPFEKLPLPVGEDEEVLVHLELEGVIQVRAIDKATNQPIPQFNVKINRTTEQRPGDPKVNGLRSELIENGTNILGDAKEYRLGQLNPGTALQVTVSADGYSPATLGRVVATLEAEGKTVDVLLEKEDPSQWKELKGLLLNENSKPVSNASVILVSSTKDPIALNWTGYRWDMVERGQLKQDPKCVNYLRTVTNEKGEFVFPRVKKAEWNELFIFGDNLVNCRFPIETTSDQLLKLQMPKPATLKLNIDPSFWTNAHSVRISQSERDSSFGYKTIPIDPTKDSITVENLPQGSYSINIQGKPEPLGGGTFTTKTLKTLQVTVEEGETLDVDF